MSCLICESANLVTADTLSGAELRTLWKSIGNNLSERAFGKMTPQFKVDLYRCVDCGFCFYDPALAGSAEFYEEMMSTSPYPVASPEFQFALDFAKQHDLKRVLDIGGGEGAFLDLAKKAGMSTTGVELNRHAAEIAAAGGHRMFNKPMEAIQLDELNGGADLVTLFQIVEHVPSPVQFVTDAARLLRPGGYMVIAVPSESRMLGLLHNDPPNWPPHHVSRWRHQDLKCLSGKVNLTLIEQKADPLPGRSIRWAFNLHNQLADALGHPNLPGGKWFPQLLSIGYRALGCKHYLNCHGLSIYAVLQKPL